MFTPLRSPRFRWLVGLIVAISLALVLYKPIRYSRYLHSQYHKFLHGPSGSPETPEDAARGMKLPAGFQASAFVGEPDVVQPIAMTFDDRGRLWVVECCSHPWGSGGSDRVLIFEDRDNDGRFDSRKTFWDQGNHLSGIAVGFDGVWLCSTPTFIFLSDADGDDVPDGAPKILLDGWNAQATHHRNED